ncbi:MAG: hypothetical protein ACKO47_05520 [Alphaproteobacteria bacterium]
MSSKTKLIFKFLEVFYSRAYSNDGFFGRAYSNDGFVGRAIATTGFISLDQEML